MNSLTYFCFSNVCNGLKKKGQVYNFKGELHEFPTTSPYEKP